MKIGLHTHKKLIYFIYQQNVRLSFRCTKLVFTCFLINKHYFLSNKTSGETQTN